MKTITAVMWSGLDIKIKRHITAKEVSKPDPHLLTVVNAHFRQFFEAHWSCTLGSQCRCSFNLVTPVQY